MDANHAENLKPLTKLEIGQPMKDFFAKAKCYSGPWYVETN